MILKENRGTILDKTPEGIVESQKQLLLVCEKQHLEETPGGISKRTLKGVSKGTPGEILKRKRRKDTS